MDLWSDAEVGENKWIFRNYSNLKIWIRLSGKEYRIFWIRGEADQGAGVFKALDFGEDPESDPDPAPDDFPPETAEQLRVALIKPGPLLKFQPLHPDRPVVVTSRVPVRLPPKQKVRYFTEIPLWIKISDSGSEDLELIELPTEDAEGTLAYSVDSVLLPEVLPVQTAPNRVLCPVSIRNNSRGTIDLKNLFISAPLLNIYRGNRFLWSNEIQIQFVAENQFYVTVNDKKPSFEPDTVMISGRRENMEKRFLKKSMMIIRTMTGLRSIE